MKSKKSILKQYFGYTQFKENQEAIIDAILAKKDVFAAMPTGGGKSLCYQLPGIFLEGLTVVISPLIALMKDQVDAAKEQGLSAEFLNSSVSSKEISRIYSQLYKNAIQLLYISPERLAIEGYLDKIKDFNVAFFAIDEAHCLSEWGHDFRPDYLFLSKLRKTFPSVPIAAFTATATQKVQDDIIRILKMKDPFTIRASFNRQELFYQVYPKTEVLSQISSFIKEHPDEAGIVYRTSRKDVEKTAAFLQSRGIKALHYHAGLSKDERSTNQDSFNNDDIDVIVATTAFGMGINKNNVRFVIHGDLPKSMEGYYQETGRAGRDSLDSTCILFFNPGDIMKQQYFIDQIASPQEQEKCRENLKSLVRFATINVCRRKQILEYFNEKHDGNCENCDVCNDVTEKIKATIDAQKILSAIARVNESFGINHIIDIVSGANTEKIRAREHHKLKTYGVGKEKSKQWWRGIINELLGQQAIFQDSERYNVLKITDIGWKILYGQEDFFIREANVSKDEGKVSRENLLDRKGTADKALLKKLKQKRNELAHENRIPPYIVFSDKTLADMAKLKPQNDDEFLCVSGVGDKKCRVYGPHFLPLIQLHLLE